MKNILEIKSLTKNYNDFKLKDINFSIPAGSIVGLIGQNGAGKSTIINCILNVVKKESGEVYILGKEMLDEDKNLRNEIGVVFDNINFHETLNIKKISSILKRIYSKWDENLFNEYISRFTLPSNKPLKEFSNGMKMKLSIAVALAHKPRLLILDEATNGLDPVVRDEVLDIFSEFVQNKENGILISSHITSDLEKIADRIIFIHNGEIIFNEEKNDLINKYYIINCSKEKIEEFKKDIIVYNEKNGECEVLITNKEVLKKDNTLIIKDTTIDKIMLLYIKGVKI